MASWDLVVENVDVATLEEGGAPYGLVPDGAVGVAGGRIAWVGLRGDLPAEARNAAVRMDGNGAVLTPGLVDCHTHLVFAGTRVGEFEARLNGATYEELAQAGGGILSTVAATRKASTEELLQGALARAGLFADHGVTTLEVKSGYGLDVDTELRMLEVAREMGRRLPLRVRATLLGAHALPPEYAGDRTAYLDLVCGEMIPRAAEEGLADAVDAFCEEIAFTPAECARVLAAGAAHGLPGRLHADQRTDQGGAALAAAHGALSADHLEHASDEGVRAMAAAGTVAVLLPGAAYFLRDATVPPVDAFRSFGVGMAVATDFNPGSSPLRAPLMSLNLACTLFRLTPEEALAGITREGARVLGLGDEVGSLSAGKEADMVLWDVDHPAELAYWMGGNPCRVVIKGGRVVRDVRRGPPTDAS